MIDQKPIEPRLSNSISVPTSSMNCPTWFTYILDAFKQPNTAQRRQRAQIRDAIGRIWEAADEVKACLCGQDVGVKTARQASEAMKELEKAYNSMFLASGRAERFARLAAESIHYEFSKEWWINCAQMREEHRHQFQQAEAKRRELTAAILDGWKKESTTPEANDPTN